MYNFLFIVFCVCVFAILHSYVFYPVILILFAPKKRKAVPLYLKEDDLPNVSILMAAYNEEKVIDKKIRSVFETNYPLDKITFYIGSDASTDRTNEIITGWSKKYSQVKLINFAGRTGKSGIINELARLSNSELFILTDANVILKPETIFNLVRHFKNEKTAQVCANIVKVSDLNSGIASQEKSYIALENKIKFAESCSWKIVMGAEGACYAIKKENFAEVPPKFYMDDFFITMNVIEQGKQIVFDKEAVCFEDVPTQSSEEFKRKVRISIGNFQNLWRYKKLLLPFWKGSAFAFLSHKVFRWLTPFFLLKAFCMSILLAFWCKYFVVIAGLQLIGFLSPLIDKLLNINFKPLRFISHFYLMNLALLKGFLIFAGGVKSNVWQPTKRNV